MIRLISCHLDSRDSFILSRLGSGKELIALPMRKCPGVSALTSSGSSLTGSSGLELSKPFILEGLSSRMTLVDIATMSYPCTANQAHATISWAPLIVRWGGLERHNQLDFPFQGRVSTEHWGWVLEYVQPYFQRNLSITMDVNLSLWVIPLHQSIGKYVKLAILSKPTHVLPTSWVILLTPILVLKVYWVVPL